ncbi:hypothetical protein AJ78_05191 [Emergomyces pasteurianus Ep9510]|uniref:Uncharacterized protein n=1 Tax=Emergomyces pasteurianus Ep9510 TaxID=1447872 RepID=A0A1J9PD07_9EURO|nr:hypothetical protein AJ78_05191 [Emergomyces pasteurianus Ep9510]
MGQAVQCHLDNFARVITSNADKARAANRAIILAMLHTIRSASRTRAGLRTLGTFCIDFPSPKLILYRNPGSGAVGMTKDSCMLSGVIQG